MSEENEQKDGETTSENVTFASTNTANQTFAGSTTVSGTPSGYVTEESYKGLQRVAEKQKTKMETELNQMRQKLEQQAMELEEAKLAAAEKAKLESAQNELTTSIQTLQAERDRLARQLNQQKIVLAEYPELAPLAAYIPVAEDEESFKANAQAFQSALKQYLQMSIKGNFEGAGPPIASGNGSNDTAVLDELWEAVYRYAGIPGKEDEYREANSKLQKALNPE